MMLLVEHRELTADAHATGRELLAELYRKATGTDMPAICIGPRGKPYFENDSLHFSITHTRHHVFCALSDKPVGIDAEELDRDIRLQLADKILSAEEKKRFEAAEDPRMTLLRLWVLKEAQGKLTGEGINGYPDHTDFSPDDPRITTQNGCLLAVITEE